MRQSSRHKGTGYQLSTTSVLVMIAAVPTIALVFIFFVGVLLAFGMSKSGQLGDVFVDNWPILLAGAASAGAFVTAQLNNRYLSLSLAALGPGMLIFLIWGGWDLLADMGWVRRW